MIAQWVVINLNLLSLFISVTYSAQTGHLIQIDLLEPLEKVNKLLRAERASLRDKNPELDAECLNRQLSNWPGLQAYFMTDTRIKINEAILKGYHDILKSLIPAPFKWWTWNDEMIELLTKSYKSDWMTLEAWKRYTANIDWQMNFWPLVHSDNEMIYEDMHAEIVGNPLFTENVITVVKRAIEQGHFKFLRSLKPSDFWFDRDIRMFWMYSFGQEWYMPAIWADLEQSMRVQIPPNQIYEWFDLGNPHLLSIPEMKPYLNIGIVLMYDSRPGAELLKKDMSSDEEFLALLETHKALMLKHFRLDVFNLYLELGGEVLNGEFSYSDIHRLETSLAMGFLEQKKISPSHWSALEMMSTKTGREFIKMAISGKVAMIEDPINEFLRITDVNSDIELFRMLYPLHPSETQQEFATYNANFAARRGEKDFLLVLKNEYNVLPDGMALFFAAIEGYFDICDWVLGLDSSRVPLQLEADDYAESVSYITALIYYHKKSISVQGSDELVEAYQKYSIESDRLDFFSLIYSIFHVVVPIKELDSNHHPTLIKFVLIMDIVNALESIYKTTLKLPSAPIVFAHAGKKVLQWIMKQNRSYLTSHFRLATTRIEELCTSSWKCIMDIIDFDLAFKNKEYEVLRWGLDRNCHASNAALDRALGRRDRELLERYYRMVVNKIEELTRRIRERATRQVERRI